MEKSINGLLNYVTLNLRATAVASIMLSVLLKNAEVPLITTKLNYVYDGSVKEVSYLNVPCAQCRL